MKQTIILIFFMISLISFGVEKSEIEQCFAKYEKAQETINVLGDTRHHKVKDIENIGKQIREIDTFKSEERSNPLYQMQRKLMAAAQIACILKCESLLSPEFQEEYIDFPKKKFPSSVKMIYSSQETTVDPECLKIPKILKAYNEAVKDYEKRKESYFWNMKLKDTIKFYKKMLFFHIRYGSREDAASRIAFIMTCINDKSKREEWLKEMLSIMRPK